MSLLYDKRWRVTIGGVRVEGLRTTFRVEKTLKPEPNVSEVVVYNLAESTRRSMQRRGVLVVLEAGYNEDQPICFAGNARTVDHVRQGPEWLTKAQSGDGEVAYRYARIAESFAAGTPTSEVLVTIAKKMGVGLGNALQAFDAGGFPTGFEAFRNGYAAVGKASTEFERLCRSAGLEWSIQDGQLQVLKVGASTRNVAVALSATTGLVGSPEHGSPNRNGLPSTLKLRSLLNGRIRPGGLVQVDALQVKGTFRVEKLVHEGDSAGSQWYTSIEALPVTPP